MGEDFDPKGKGYLLGTHILEKGFQAGSLVGVLIVGPLAAYRLSRHGGGDIVRKVVKACGTSAVVGTALAGTAWPGRHECSRIQDKDSLLHSRLSSLK